MSPLLLIILVLLVLSIGGAPIYNGNPWINHPYGWGPSGLSGVLILVLLILLLTGRL